MRVVLDTNVIVSAVLTTQGNCARILDLLLDGQFTLCADARILGEYAEVLRRPKLDLPLGEIETLLKLLRQLAEPVVAPPLSAAIPDQQDLPFLEVAHAGEALLVTENLRHFPPESRSGVMVISPAEFLAGLG